MNLRTEEIRKSVHQDEIKKIYTSSFLKEDRMPFWMMTIMSYLRNTEFLSFYDKDVLCGFVYMATIKKQTLIMFFAVDETLRSKGYGSRILEQIQAMYPQNKIIITIEPCDEAVPDLETRQRRKRFYLKNGYEEAGYFIKLAGKKQEIIIKNGTFDKGELRRFFMQYSNFTMIPKIWSTDS